MQSAKKLSVIENHTVYQGLRKAKTCMAACIHAGCYQANIQKIVAAAAVAGAAAPGMYAQISQRNQ